MIVRIPRNDDLHRIELQENQEQIKSLLDCDIDLQSVGEANQAWTMEHEGEIMAVVGLEPQWEGRAIAWTFISKHAGKCFVALHKAVTQIMDASGYRRIETTVDVGFKQGHRWAKMTGFEVEGLMKAYRPDGADMVLYARIR